MEEKMTKVFAKSGDPDQMSDLGLRCLPVAFFVDLPTKLG